MNFTVTIVAPHAVCSFSWTIAKGFVLLLCQSGISLFVLFCHSLLLQNFLPFKAKFSLYNASLFHCTFLHPFVNVGVVDDAVLDTTVSSVFGDAACFAINPLNPESVV